ncbi:MAG: molybdopterin cofactor-binding domain-containing protein [Solirubrobacteraceae bacterium]
MIDAAALPESLLPENLRGNPLLSTWLQVRGDGTVSVCPGKVELGQGIRTALAQLAADELDVAIGRVRMVPVATPASPDEGHTAGSRSIQESGAAVRQACAEVRQLFLDAAAKRLGCPVGELEVNDGEVSSPDGSTSTSYWELAGAVSLDRSATGAVAPRPLGSGRAAGRPVPRIDLRDMLLGRPSFVHDLRLPGMLHGRVVRPPYSHARLLRVGTCPAEARTVRDGSFLGAISAREEHAVKARNQLMQTTIWERSRELPDSGDISCFLRMAPSVEERLIDDHLSHGHELVDGVVRSHRASYSRPFLAHASIGPSCAVARWEDGRLEVWCASQGVYALRSVLARCFSLAPSDIVVRHVPGSGCYGHNGADDVAFEAALLARAVPGTPVRLQWMRDEELGWAPFGPAMVAVASAELGADGAVLSFGYDVWGNGSGGRPGEGGRPNLFAASQLATPLAPPLAVEVPHELGGGTSRNAIPLYRLGRRRISSHWVSEMPVRTSALRSLGAFGNVFAIESFLDELALLADADPLEYRLRHLDDARAVAVLRTAADVSGWSGRARDSQRGMGIAVARYKNQGGYCAVVAEVEAVERLRVLRLTAAVDVGFAVNPDGIENQVMGGAVQAASWTLTESVSTDENRVTSTGWDRYPILRFSEVPQVHVVVVHGDDRPPLGVGEIVQGPTAAAIANALFDAIGVRVRDLPLTRQQILTAIEG